MEITRGRGIDVIILACSRVIVDDVLLGMLAPCGRISVFSGTPASIAPIRMDANTLHYKEITVSGAYGCTARQNAEAIALMEAGIRPSETLQPCTLPLESVAEGLAVTTSNSVFKAILEVSNG
jgi:L-iditol 2-dehydrogenase